jgi:hypothetical protein
MNRAVGRSDPAKQKNRSRLEDSRFEEGSRSQILCQVFKFCAICHHRYFPVSCGLGGLRPQEKAFDKSTHKNTSDG